MQQNQLPTEQDPWQQEGFDAPEEYDDKGPFDRFAEAFSAPSEAFQGLERSPRKSPVILWGILLGSLVIVFATLLFTAHPTLGNAAVEKQKAALEKKYEAGEISEKDRDAAIKYMESAVNGEGIMQYVSLVSAPIVSIIGWTLASLIVYGIASALNRDNRAIDFTTSMATYMIALMIPLLEKVLHAIGMYLTGDINFSIDPNLLVGSENNLVKFGLSLLGPFVLWWFYVLGTGISTVSGGSRAAAIGIWALTYIVVTGAMVVVGSIFAGGM